MGVSQLRVDRLVVRSIFSRDFLWIFLSLKKDPELADLLKMPGKVPNKFSQVEAFLVMNPMGSQSSRNHQGKKSKEVFENSEIVKNSPLGCALPLQQWQTDGIPGS